MLFEYFLDMVEYYRNVIQLDQYILFLCQSGFKGSLPGVKFWAITLFISQNRKIMIGNHVLTPKDCIRELEDCYLQLKLKNKTKSNKKRSEKQN
jgi:hypothetical protein